MQFVLQKEEYLAERKSALEEQALRTLQEDLPNSYKTLTFKRRGLAGVSHPK